MNSNSELTNMINSCGEWPVVGTSLERRREGTGGGGSHVNIGCGAPASPT